MLYLPIFTLAASVLVTQCDGLSRKDACTAATLAYTQMGFPVIDVPTTARKGRKSQICYASTTCCSEEMEDNFKSFSKTNLGRQIANYTEYTRTGFITATAQFNEFFLDLLKTTQSDLDRMFNSAYGLMYKQNEDVFKQLFANFQRYYKNGDINLNEAMNTFFTDVFTRMFVMQSPEYMYSSKYMACISSKMQDLQPFGDIPATVSRNVRQAFVAARTFVQGLAVGRNVALKMAEVQVTDSCTDAYVKHSICPTCLGMSNVLPCLEYCVNVIGGCLAYHSQISDSWVKYTEAMDDLAERLEGSGNFNIDVVITPLKDLISEAIMAYHENSKPVRDKMFSNDMCGTPPAANSRGKRGIRSKKKQRGQAKTVIGQQSRLVTLVRDIKLRIKRVKAVWTNLPGTMCNNTLTAKAGSRQCWNGDEINRYSKTIAGNGVLANVENPEVYVSLGDANSIVNEQIAELEKAARHLSNAKLGIDVDWLDFDINVLPVSKSVGTVPEMETNRHTTQMSIETNSMLSVSTLDDEDNIVLGSSGEAPSKETKSESTGAYIDVGSGYNSVRITPFSSTSKVKGNKQKEKNKRPERLLETGSGTLYEEDGPFLIPIVANSQNSGKVVNPDTIEGSGGPILFNTYISPDDEDYYVPIPKKDNPNSLNKNIKEVVATPKRLNLDVSTPKSSSKSLTFSTTWITFGTTICLVLFSL